MPTLCAGDKIFGELFSLAILLFKRFELKTYTEKKTKPSNIFY